MKRNHKARHRIIIGTAGVGLALALVGCDSRTSAPGATQVPARTTGIDKNAPLEQQVRALITEQLGLKTTPKATDRLVEDLGADSLDTVELVMAMEEEFNISIPDEEAVKMKTLGDIVAFLEKSANPAQER